MTFDLFLVVSQTDRCAITGIISTAHPHVRALEGTAYFLKPLVTRVLFSNRTISGDSERGTGL